MTEIAEQFGMSQNTIRLWITRGLIEAHRNGRKWMIDPEVVRQMLAANPQLGMPRIPARRATHGQTRAELSPVETGELPRRDPDHYRLMDSLDMS